MDDRTGHEQQAQQLRRGHAGRHAILRGGQRRDDVHVEWRTVERQTERLGAHSHHAVSQVKQYLLKKKKNSVSPIHQLLRP